MQGHELLRRLLGAVTVPPEGDWKEEDNHEDGPVVRTNDMWCNAATLIGICMKYVQDHKLLDKPRGYEIMRRIMEMYRALEKRVGQNYKQQVRDRLLKPMVKKYLPDATDWQLFAIENKLPRIAAQLPQYWGNAKPLRFLLGSSACAARPKEWDAKRLDPIISDTDTDGVVYDELVDALIDVLSKGEELRGGSDRRQMWIAAFGLLVDLYYVAMAAGDDAARSYPEQISIRVWGVLHEFVRFAGQAAYHQMAWPPRPTAVDQVDHFTHIWVVQQAANDGNHEKTALALTSMAGIATLIAAMNLAPDSVDGELVYRKAPPYGTLRLEIGGKELKARKHDGKEFTWQWALHNGVKTNVEKKQQSPWPEFQEESIGIIEMMQRAEEWKKQPEFRMLTDTDDKVYVVEAGVAPCLAKRVHMPAAAAASLPPLKKAKRITIDLTEDEPVMDTGKEEKKQQRMDTGKEEKRKSKLKEPQKMDTGKEEKKAASLSIGMQLSSEEKAAVEYAQRNLGINGDMSAAAYWLYRGIIKKHDQKNEQQITCNTPLLAAALGHLKSLNKFGMGRHAWTENVRKETNDAINLFENSLFCHASTPPAIREFPVHAVWSSCSDGLRKAFPNLLFEPRSGHTPDDLDIAFCNWFNGDQTLVELKRRFLSESHINKSPEERQMACKLACMLFFLNAAGQGKNLFDEKDVMAMEDWVRDFGKPEDAADGKRDDDFFWEVAVTYLMYPVVGGKSACMASWEILIKDGHLAKLGFINSTSDDLLKPLPEAMLFLLIALFVIAERPAVIAMQVESKQMDWGKTDILRRLEQAIDQDFKNPDRDSNFYVLAGDEQGIAVQLHNGDRLSKGDNFLRELPAERAKDLLDPVKHQAVVAQALCTRARDKDIEATCDVGDESANAFLRQLLDSKPIPGL